jgi:hypothetical protein
VFYSVISLPLGAITMARFQRTSPDVPRRTPHRPRRRRPTALGSCRCELGEVE